MTTEKDLTLKEFIARRKSFSDLFRKKDRESFLNDMLQTESLIGEVLDSPIKKQEVVDGRYHNLAFAALITEYECGFIHTIPMVSSPTGDLNIVTPRYPERITILGKNILPFELDFFSSVYRQEPLDYELKLYREKIRGNPLHSTKNTSQRENSLKVTCSLSPDRIDLMVLHHSGKIQVRTSEEDFGLKLQTTSGLRFNWSYDLRDRIMPQKKSVRLYLSDNGNWECYFAKDGSLEAMVYSLENLQSPIVYFGEFAEEHKNGFYDLTGNYVQSEITLLPKAREVMQKYSPELLSGKCIDFEKTIRQIIRGESDDLCIREQDTKEETRVIPLRKKQS